MQSTKRHKLKQLLTLFLALTLVLTQGFSYSYAEETTPNNGETGVENDPTATEYTKSTLNAALGKLDTAISDANLAVGELSKVLDSAKQCLPAEETAELTAATAKLRDEAAKTDPAIIQYKKDIQTAADALSEIQKKIKALEDAAADSSGNDSTEPTEAGNEPTTSGLTDEDIVKLQTDADQALATLNEAVKVPAIASEQKALTGLIKDLVTETVGNLTTDINNANTAVTNLTNVINSVKLYLTTENEAVYTPKTLNALKDETEKAEKAKTDYESAISAAGDSLKAIREKLPDTIQATEAEQTTEAANDNASAKEETKELSAEELVKLQKEAEEAGKKLNTAVSLTDINTEQTTLQNLINSLIKQADKTTLANTITTAESKKSTNYFSEEYNALQTAITDAKKVFDNKDATSIEVTNANKALTKAIKALRVIYTQSGDTRYYNIENFETYGYDYADDTAAIQEALDLSSSDYKINISFPAGTFYLSKALYIQSNTTLALNPGTTMYRMDSALELNMLKSSDANHKMGTSGKYKLAHDIVVTGGAWDGGNIAQSTKACNLLYFGHTDGLTITNTTVKHCYGSHAIELAGVQNATIEYCTFTDFRYGSNSYTSEAIQMDICWKSDADGDWAPGYKQDKTTCNNITIRNNTIIDYPRGIGTHHQLSSAPYTNITIENNNIYRSSVDTQGKCITGIFLVGVEDATVKSNTVNSYYYGIWIKSSSSLTVKKNILKYNSYTNLIYDSNDVADKQVRFTFVKVKNKKVTGTKAPAKGKNKIFYTAQGMKKGYLKTKGKKYRFSKAKTYYQVKLKKKLKKNQKINLFGQDKDGNKFYRVYYVGQ